MKRSMLSGGNLPREQYEGDIDQKGHDCYTNCENLIPRKFMLLLY